MIINSITLKRTRIKQKLSQAELASSLELSQSTIWEWEKEDTNVKLEHVLKLCEVLKIDIAEISKESIHVNLQNIKPSNEYIEKGFDVEYYAIQKQLINNLMKQVSYLEDTIQRLIGYPG